MPANRVGSVVEASARQGVPQFDDQINGGLRQPSGAGVWAPRLALESGRALGPVAGHSPRDPALRDPVLAGPPPIGCDPRR